VPRRLTFALLRDISAARFTSGATLATRHGVSRSAVSDAFKDATAIGVPVYSLTRRGYRLAEPLDLLDLDTVRRNLGEAQHRLNLDILDVVDSTSTAVMNQALLGAATGTCVAAELQTAARGRRGRAWHSGLATSLTFSLLWRFDRGAASLGGLSLAIGVAVARALRALGVAAELKWPNDIVIRDHKLGGILIETQGDMLGPTAAVIGIGINVRLPEALEAAIDQPVTDIARAVAGHAVASPALNRSVLLAEVLKALVNVLDAFQQEGFAPLRDSWRALHAHEGREVQVVSGADSYRARVLDVAADGALIVARDGATVALNAAEISVRAGST
jgi:BirA family biotin operon repressor/biotin-[acetyl-CoA-carboxylase] ligase